MNEQFVIERIRSDILADVYGATERQFGFATCEPEYHTRLAAAQHMSIADTRILRN